jgi:hypothetical protein
MSSFKKEKKYHTKRTKADTQFIGSHHHHSSLVGSHHLYCILKERERGDDGSFHQTKKLWKVSAPPTTPEFSLSLQTLLACTKKTRFSVVVMGMFGYGDVWRRTCQNTIVLRHYFHHFFTFSHFSRFYHQSTVIVDGSCRYDNDLCII